MKTILKAAVLAVATASAAQASTIVEIAAGDERFSTLVTAVTAAGLAETLSGPGPFTVSAPLNDAFAALPEGTVETLLQPVLASERLCITAGSSGVAIADGTGETANVVVADIQASNGVIHVIDKVLLPGTRPDCH